jgi:hypothetical protein
MDVSELRSAIEGYRSEALGELPDARAEEDFAELQRARESLEAERLRRLADLDRRGIYRADGHLSAVSWLVAVFGIGGGQAKRDVSTARALEDMPMVREAFEEGAISSSKVRMLADAQRAEPEAFGSSEAMLLEAAGIHSVRGLGRVVGYWREAAENARRSSYGFGDEDPLHERRHLYASPTMSGMVKIDGLLDPENGETFLTSMGAVHDVWARSGPGPDDRTASQRRADALGEVCRRSLDTPEGPTVAGEHPHITVTVALEALVEGEGTAELDHVGPVDAGLARRIACEASVSRIVLGPRSEPLDVGRRTPVVPHGMRRAVVVRDGHCRFPGCDRHHTWCDAHHVVHWADGGPTALNNLVLLCRRHHRMVHQRFGVEMAYGRPVFRRPDGSVLEERAPP